MQNRASVTLEHGMTSLVQAKFWQLIGSVPLHDASPASPYEASCSYLSYLIFHVQGKHAADSSIFALLPPRFLCTVDYGIHFVSLRTALETLLCRRYFVTPALCHYFSVYLLSLFKRLFFPRSSMTFITPLNIKKRALFFCVACKPFHK